MATRGIAAALESYGPVDLVAVEDASATVWDHCDLLVVGGPTEGRHATPPVRAFFDRLPSHALRGIDAAAFDTRLDWPLLLSGSAAGQIRRQLIEAGAHMICSPESFRVSASPELCEGELERAPDWARAVARACHAERSRHAMASPGVA